VVFSPAASAVHSASSAASAEAAAGSSGIALTANQAPSAACAWGRGGERSALGQVRGHAHHFSCFRNEIRAYPEGGQRLTPQTDTRRLTN